MRRDDTQIEEWSQFISKFSPTNKELWDNLFSKESLKMPSFKNCHSVLITTLSELCSRPPL
ncbi:hypothetical protein SOVF_152970 [Spinacia oleracea]|nr:hypothetical protein SOVF_152970 [Spinacia oleracea]